VAPQDSEIAVEILQSVNNLTQCLRKILRMIITDIVGLINTLLGRVTLDPAGMHCPWWDDAFISSFSCINCAIDTSNKYCLLIYSFSHQFHCIMRRK